ncbi:MAG TPA: LysM peptidoglycan-binding domain-containing protein, partial [Burkholderiaceae bacterium]|nr:LysM peptidoglycan-binding domain-containing protein [Burkholderiaceae bacterium]
LSRRYGVSSSNLAEWNPGLGSGTLRKGQTVVVFVPVRATAPAAQRSKTPATGTRTVATKAAPRKSATSAAKPLSQPAAKSATRPIPKAKR